MNEDTLRAFNYGARREASGDSATVRAATLIDHLIMSSFRTRCLNVGHKAAAGAKRSGIQSNPSLHLTYVFVLRLSLCVFFLLA